MKTIPDSIIDIPMISDYDLFNRNVDRAENKGLDHCPCCGKGLENPKYFFNSIYGGQAYPANEIIENSDSWVMGVGTECRKKFPEGYVFENRNNE